MFNLYRYLAETWLVASRVRRLPGKRHTGVQLQLEELEPRLIPSVDWLSNLTPTNATPDVQVVTPVRPHRRAFQGSPPDSAPNRSAKRMASTRSPSTTAPSTATAKQTIAIVDAYSQPHLASDLATFDSTYGIPAPPRFTVVNQNGGTILPAANPKWGLEESLDVEWAHAMAPGANILLVEANSGNWSDLMTAVNFARNQPGVSVVSLSWGGPEWSTETSYDSYFTTPSGHNGVTFVASSGDSGSAGALLFPSLSPNVLAVGGTQLGLSSTGQYSSETGWLGSGGGISADESQPSYQKGIVTQTSTRRAVPDVAYNAADGSPYAVYDSSSYGGWLRVAGTSAGAAQWAALVAIADQGRALNGHGTLDGARQTLLALYQLPISDFHDITSGNNGADPDSPGYDLVTGRGSPRANQIVAGLVSYDTKAATGSAAWVVKPASASPTTVSTRTTNLSVLGGDSAGASSLTYTWWALSGPAGAPLPTYSVNGTNAAENTTVTFYKAGTYTLRATIEAANGLTTTSDITVTVKQTLTSVAITPGNPNVADGGTQQFKATALDQFGNAMSTQPSWTWTLSSGVGRLSSSGLFTAPTSGTGNATVQATGGGRTGSTSLRVGPPPAAPSNLTAVVISSQQVNLSWQDHSSDETGFIIQRSTNGGSWTTIARVGANGTTFSDKTVSSGKPYSYRVGAYNSFGDSAYSNTTAAIRPAANVAGAAGAGTAAVLPDATWGSGPTTLATKGAADVMTLTALLVETAPHGSSVNEDALWLTWSEELAQNNFVQRQLFLPEAWWQAWGYKATENRFGKPLF